MKTDKGKLFLCEKITVIKKDFLFSEEAQKAKRIIDPTIIISLGRHALQKFLADKKISEVHGKAQQINWRDKQITVLPLYHPAAALHQPELKPTLKEDFLKIKKYL